MNIKTRIASALVAGGMVAGLVATATPASATTPDRGSTQILSCTDVASVAASVKDANKVGLTVASRNIKSAGIQHAEKDVPGTATYAKYEPDPTGTPDVGDTDTCTGALTQNNALNPWFNAGIFTPYGPTQNLTGPFNEITKIAGALTGRANCDQSGAPPANTDWTLHGKLTAEFGNQAAVGTPLTPTSLDALGKKVSSQVYVNTSRPIPTKGDLILLSGIGIKGTGEGAYFDSQVQFTAAAADLNSAIESCITNTDLNADGIVGIPPYGGLSRVTTDTNVEGDNTADYQNSMDWSI